MAQPDGPQSEPPPSTKQRFLRRLFGGIRQQSESASQPPIGLPSGPLSSDQREDAESVESSDPVRRNTSRHGWGSVVPGLPRAQTFKRQLSESRAHLAPVQPSIDERRAVSMDRRSNDLRARAPNFPTDDETHASDPSLIHDFHEQPITFQVPSVARSDVHEEPLPDVVTSNGTSVGYATATPDTMSETHSISDSEYEAQIRSELERKWILNLSMHFKDHSRREKFFVTYRESEHSWRRVTVSLDYRNAPPNSLEMDLIHTKFQRDKNQKIYEAIRESLADIHFFETVTNLKLETTDGRLHVHVVEDGNEIIHYPPVSQVAHLGCRRIPESDVEFHSHMSGFVYKVSVGGEILIKKEIPSPETIEEFLYEINALNSLSYSNNVINFHGVVVDESDEHVKGLLISYADGGALIDVIYDNCKDPNGHGLAWSVRERWARQIVQGLADIHESGFVQGDFTLSNIVVDQKDDAKIIDINRRGCPVGWEPPEATPLIESNHRISMYIGIKSDLYQLGMVLWALAMEEDEPDLEGRPLFLGAEAKVPDWYRLLTETCLSPDPRRRLQASQLVQMFPPDVKERETASVDDGVSIESFYANGMVSAPSEWSHCDARYVPAGPPAYEPWNYAPRGRSPPSPLPSNPDLSESHRGGVHSPTAWAARRFIRPSYSDAGVDEIRPDDIVQNLTPTPTAERIVFPEGDLHIDDDAGDGEEGDPSSDLTPTERENATSLSGQALDEASNIARPSSIEDDDLKDDIAQTDVDTDQKAADASEEATSSGPLAEISPNITKRESPLEVETGPLKTSDEVATDAKPATDANEEPTDNDAAAPQLPIESESAEPKLADMPPVSDATASTTEAEIPLESKDEVVVDNVEGEKQNDTSDHNISTEPGLDTDESAAVQASEEEQPASSTENETPDAKADGDATTSLPEPRVDPLPEQDQDEGERQATDAIENLERAHSPSEDVNVATEDAPTEPSIVEVHKGEISPPVPTAVEEPPSVESDKVEAEEAPLPDSPKDELAVSNAIVEQDIPEDKKAEEEHVAVPENPAEVLAVPDATVEQSVSEDQKVEAEHIVVPDAPIDEPTAPDTTVEEDGTKSEEVEATSVSINDALKEEPVTSGSAPIEATLAEATLDEPVAESTIEEPKDIAADSEVKPALEAGPDPATSSTSDNPEVDDKPAQPESAQSAAVDVTEDAATGEAESEAEPQVLPEISKELSSEQKEQIPPKNTDDGEVSTELLEQTKDDTEHTSEKGAAEQETAEAITDAPVTEPVALKLDEPAVLEKETVPDITDAPSTESVVLNLDEPAIPEKETVPDINEAPPLNETKAIEPQTQEEPQDPQGSEQVNPIDGPSLKEVTEAEQIISEIPEVDGSIEPDGRSGKETTLAIAANDATTAEKEPSETLALKDAAGDVNHELSDATEKTAVVAGTSSTSVPDSLAGIGSGLSDVGPSMIPQRDLINEDDFHVGTKPESVST